MAPTRKGVIASAGHLDAHAISLGALVREIAQEAGVRPSQVALAWLLRRPGCTAPILGARTAAQLEDNLGALDVELSEEQWRRLDDASRPAPIFPARFMARPLVRQLMFGHTHVVQRDPTQG